MTISRAFEAGLPRKVSSISAIGRVERHNSSDCGSMRLAKNKFARLDGKMYGLRRMTHRLHPVAMKGCVAAVFSAREKSRQEANEFGIVNWEYRKSNDHPDCSAGVSVQVRCRATSHRLN